MPEQIASARAARRGPRWRRRAVVGVAVAVAAVVLATAGRRGAARVAREIASSHMNACEFGAVQRWAGWCAILDPSDYHADLLRAARYRQLGQAAAWQASLDEAAGKNAPPGAIAAERKLDEIRNGEFHQGDEAELGALTEAGASQTDVAAAFVFGYLARSDAKAARLFLEKMSPYFTDGAQQDYLWGIFLLWQEDRDIAGARARLARVLEINPGHELARTELGFILQADNDLEGALGQFVELAARSGGSLPARIGLAHVLRKMGRIDEARSVLAALDSEREPGPEFQFEMAQIALEGGDYEDAERRCRGIPFINAETLGITALALTFRQKPQEAQRLSLKAAALDDAHNWEVEMKFRLTADPRDLTAAKERARLTGPGIAALIDSQEAPIELPGLAPTDKAPTDKAPTDKAAAAAGELFRVHCSNCHGPRGDGQGMAAHYLFPRPRNLRAGICRLVGTVNGVPALDDVEQVLARGMPGTSMPSFEELPASDRRLLAEEVLRLRGAGVREQIRAAFRHEGEEIDESDVAQAVRRATTPGQPAPLPAQWPDPAQAALRGKANFATLGCVKCHGEAGTGAADQDLFDDLG
ncbi:MAG: tetratricopeptide repeat protein, partial [Thermoguttaceae bacterium]